MANKTVFERILTRGMKEGKVPGKSKDAREWYRKKAQKENAAVRKNIIQDKVARKRVVMGKMYFFVYDAKTKEELPYWDAFPLIFPFRTEGKYFHGINMHYLPPMLRAKLMDSLYPLATDTKYNERTRMMLSWKILQSISTSKLSKICVKKYLKSHVRSRFIEVTADEWDIALWLPLADWRGANAQKVYADARKKLG